MQQYKGVFYEYNIECNFWTLSDSEDLSIATMCDYDADYTRLDQAIDNFITEILPSIKRHY